MRKRPAANRQLINAIIASVLAGRSICSICLFCLCRAGHWCAVFPSTHATLSACRGIRIVCRDVAKRPIGSAVFGHLRRCGMVEGAMIDRDRRRPGQHRGFPGVLPTIAQAGIAARSCS